MTAGVSPPATAWVGFRSSIQDLHLLSFYLAIRFVGKERFFQNSAAKTEKSTEAMDSDSIIYLAKIRFISVFILFDDEFRTMTI